MKTALYLRVSTSEQNTDNQQPVLEAWAKQRAFEVVAVYQEKESAWKAGHQVELKYLIADARLHKFELVLVWALDRLSREGSAAILNLINTLKLYGVKVISYQESWTEAPGELGELLFAIAGWVARMESQRRSERTKAGLNRAIKEGKLLGRPKGSKDKGKRRRTGYLLRYDNKRSANFSTTKGSKEMFLRISVVKGKQYFRLVESYRENGKVKQRHLHSFGNFEHWLDDGMVDYVADVLEDTAEHPEAYGTNRKERAKNFKEIASNMIKNAKQTKVRQ